MYTVYHHPLDAGSRYVRLLLAEYEEGATFIEEKAWERRPEFLRLNPAGAIPVLQIEDNECFCGPVVIGEYLDESHGIMMRARRLMPENPIARGEVRRLVEWFNNKFELEVNRYIIHERVYKQLMKTDEGGGSPDTSVIRIARMNLANHLKYLNSLLSSRDWIAGTDLSAADFAAAAALSVLDYLGEISWEDFPTTKDWYARIKSRPSFRPLLTEKMVALPPVSHYMDLDF